MKITLDLDIRFKEGNLLLKSGSGRTLIFPKDHVVQKRIQMVALAELSDLTIEDGKFRGMHTIDGVSIAGLIKSDGDGKLEREAIYWHFPTYLKYSNNIKGYLVTPCGAIRKGKYKLIEFFEIILYYF